MPTPNTNFTAGQILTAAQQNNFPRGIVSQVRGTAPSAIVSVETVLLTAPAFTAVANRFYKLTYFQPVFSLPVGTVNHVSMRIRLTNISGTEQAYCEVKMASAGSATGVATIVTTLSAGSTVLVATFAPVGGGTIVASGSGLFAAQLVVEDLGPI